MLRRLVFRPTVNHGGVSLLAARRYLFARSTPTILAPKKTSSNKNTPVKLSDKEVVQWLSKLEKDDAAMQRFLSKVDPDTRRKLTICGVSYELFGKESVPGEVKAADTDNDRVISPKDFNKWFQTLLKRKVLSNGDAATMVEGQQQQAPDAATTEEVSKPKKRIPIKNRDLLLTAIASGLPFVGFGFLDNSMMILCGDAIDHTVGFYLGCSVMASAAMGNVCSGIVGMQVHGSVERLLNRLGLPEPNISPEQSKSRKVFFAGHLGGTLGIAVGLTCGMLPLWFIHTEEDDKSILRVFNDIDVNESGSLSVAEIKKGVKQLHFDVSDEEIDEILRTYGCRSAVSGELELTFGQFKKLVESYKEALHHCGDDIDKMKEVMREKVTVAA